MTKNKYWYQFQNSFYFKIRNMRLFLKQDIFIFIFFLLFLFFFNLFHYFNTAYKYYIAMPVDDDVLVNTLPMLVSLIGLIRVALFVFTVGILTFGMLLVNIFWAKLLNIFKIDIAKKRSYGMPFKDITFDFLAFDFLMTGLLGIFSMPIAFIFFNKIVILADWLLPVDIAIETLPMSTLFLEVFSIFVIALVIYALNFVSIRKIGTKYY